MYTAAVITISDKGYRGERVDTSGPNLVQILKEKGFDVVYTAIVPDDSVKFLEDQRAYKAKLQGNGRPLDHYAFLLLDVSELEAIVSTIVEVAGTVATKEQA